MWIILFFKVFLILIIFHQSDLSGQDIITISGDSEIYSIGSKLFFFIDDANELGIDEITTPNIDKEFISNESKSPNFGRTRATVWAKFDVRNKSLKKDWLLEIEYPVMLEVSLFYKDDMGEYQEKRDGVLVPYEKREFKHRNIVFKLPPLSADVSTFYLRVHTKTAVVFPVNIISETAIIEKGYREMIIFGLYYGALLVMVLYNLMLAISLKESTYYLYIFFVINYGLYQFFLDGLADMYFIGTYTNLQMSFHMFFIGMFFSFAFLFSRKFLNTKLYLSILDKTLLILAVFSGILGFSAFIIDPYILNQFYIYWAIIWITVMIGSAVYIYKKGYEPAKLFIIALFLFFIGLFLRVSRNVAILPENFFTHYGMHIGSLFEVVLFSLAISFKIKVLTQEKELIKNETRNKIARNLHDDIGSTLTGITFFSEALERKSTDENNITNDYISKIKLSAREAQDKIKDLIWTVNPDNDNWQDLLVNFRRFSSDIFESKNIRYKINFPNELPKNQLQMEFRQDLWLVLKEIVTNIVKHAKCDEVTIDVTLVNGNLKFDIRDNGVGFDAETINNGNGLTNIKARVERIKAEMEILTEPGNGVRWKLGISIN